MDALIQTDEKLTLSSREVAGMVGKKHSHLLRDIRRYIDYIDQNPELDFDNYFIESSYQAGTGKKYFCYEITKKGCEFIAHKLTGEKGAQFTAAYIEKFHEMENKLNKPESVEDLIIMQAKSLKNMKQKVNKVENEVESVKDTFAKIEENWRNYVNNVFSAIGNETGNFSSYRKESYMILNRRARCDLDRRLQNKRERMRQNGATKTAINETNKLDIIEEDERLKEIYIKIVQEMEAKHL